jgi:hypothetical protein
VSVSLTTPPVWPDDALSVASLVALSVALSVAELSVCVVVTSLGLLVVDPVVSPGPTLVMPPVMPSEVGFIESDVGSLGAGMVVDV